MEPDDHLFLDANVVLDHLSQRESFARPAGAIFALAVSGKVKLHVSALTFCTVHYILRRSIGTARAKEMLKDLAITVSITPLRDLEIRVALDSASNDFEDAAQLQSALSVAKISTVITRDKNDFEPSRLRLMTPDEYLLNRAASRT